MIGSDLFQGDKVGDTRARFIDEENGGLERGLRESGLIPRLRHAGRGSADRSDIIVTGGRGIGSSGNFRHVLELAEALGGMAGATRAAVEAGWIEYEYKIGQTGRKVFPKVYVACGVSGAVQHLAGVQAELLVAVNSDPDAPIFQLADYGILGDVEKIIPLIIHLLNQQA
ncbi:MULTISPECIES: electron transfer flavoprotein subunit alpha/FixB family protein [Paenibacillus]|uniref:Subunit alpha of electron transfer flavoprotein n=1 Tax=Paenibacillus naphthalenovorans TaxID=162209 RepID=A0A0U2U510_9BACL|nr:MULTISPECIES: electron transfer flavoprotein subunit alpha/FixB family protein [Paenibacillus]ALS21336.1 subunit alpha of electron transfer flavoprotein [Paenibacillus naphthalenovorans]NTZ18503.1 electron transfer flavoprotein subunit alpha/FixB family protein [Paenibacillus sp. JMULE4]